MWTNNGIHAIGTTVSLELSQKPQNSIAMPHSVSVARRVPNSGSFAPGKSGNPGGRPRSAKFRRIALRHLELAVAGDTTQADCVVDAIIQKAINEGDVAAFTALRDTVDGKPQADSGAGGQISIAIQVVNVGE